MREEQEEVQRQRCLRGRGRERDEVVVGVKRLEIVLRCL